MKFTFLSLFFFISILSFSEGPIKVLASNSWTAAYVRAAGIENVELLAPSDMLHPSEYELSIDDFKKVDQADLIVFAGYEVVIQELQKMSNVDKSKFLKIETGYNFDKIAESIRRIASKTKTIDQAGKSIENIRKTFDVAKSEVKAKGLTNQPVIAHFFQEQFAREIGLNPVAIFGPAPLESYDLVELSGKKVVLIIDNIHNPVSQPLVEIVKNVRCVELINFPGIKNTRSIEDVIRYNVKQIVGN
jgi:zinc transport system substrate-binding protein